MAPYVESSRMTSLPLITTTHYWVKNPGNKLTKGEQHFASNSQKHHILSTQKCVGL